MKSTAEKKQRSFGKLLVTAGVLLLLGAAGLFGYNQWTEYQAGLQSEEAVTELVTEIQNRDVATVERPDGASKEFMKVAELDGAYYIGVLTIPSLDRILPVQSDWSMPKLKRSPCRYSGTLTEGNLVIAGHNYRTHFTGLARLSLGDSIIFTDLDGVQTLFEVKEIYTIDPTNIDGMVHSDYPLTLFTCNYGGKARVTVRCDRVMTED